MKKFKVFIAGPIRPTKNDVIRCIANVRENFPDCEIFLSVWDSNYESNGRYSKEDLNDLNSIVDHFLLSEEPTDEFIENEIIRKGNVSHLMTGTTWKHPAIHGIYRSHIGLKKIFDYIEENNLCEEDDICVRYRTDLIVKISGDLNDLIEDSKKCYMVYNSLCSGVEFNDWFGISTYNNIKRAWYFEKIDCVECKEFNEYISIMSKSTNAESIIKNKLIENKIPIVHFSRVKFPQEIIDFYNLDKSKLDDGKDGYAISEIGIMRKEPVVYPSGYCSELAYMP